MDADRPPQVTSKYRLAGRRKDCRSRMRWSDQFPLKRDRLLGMSCDEDDDDSKLKINYSFQQANWSSNYRNKINNTILEIYVSSPSCPVAQRPSQASIWWAWCKTTAEKTQDNHKIRTHNQSYSTKINFLINQPGTESGPPLIHYSGS